MAEFGELSSQDSSDSQLLIAPIFSPSNLPIVPSCSLCIQTLFPHSSPPCVYTRSTLDFVVATKLIVIVYCLELRMTGKIIYAYH